MYWHQCLNCTNSHATSIQRKKNSEQKPALTWQLSVGRTVGPTDIKCIPTDLSDHILHDYVHNKCKIILFHVQNNLYIWTTTMHKSSPVY